MFTVSALYKNRMIVPEDPFASAAQRFAKQTGFTAESVRKLHHEFSLYAKPHRERGYALMLDSSRLLKLLKAHSVPASPIIQAIFRAYDTDNENVIGFSEYLSLLAIFKAGTRELQATLFFRLCDVEREGYLDKLRTLKFLSSSSPGLQRDQKKEMNSTVNYLLSVCGDGHKAQYKDFIEHVTTDNQVLHIPYSIYPI